MGALLTVFLKELKDNLRDRRTLLTALVFGPLGAPLLFALMITITVQRGAERNDGPIELDVAGREHAPNFVAFLEQNGAVVTAFGGGDEAAAQHVRAKRAATVIVIPPDFGERLRQGQPVTVKLYADTSNTSTNAVQSRTLRLIQGYSSQIASQRLQARGVSPLLAQPIYPEVVDVATPAGRALLVLGMLSYFIVFSTLVGGMYVAIDATAGERERGSLEPLLTVAVPRERLAQGKIAAACFFMVLSLALALLGFVVALKFVPLEQLGMKANFGPSVALTVFVVMLPFVLVGASLMTIVAGFTRSFREAQSWLTALLLVPTVPIMFAAIYQVQATDRLMWIPSLGQHLIVNSLLRAEPLQPQHVAMSVAATLLLGLALAWVAARLYRREAILG
jgi:sodium transport system permease protein